MDNSKANPKDPAMWHVHCLHLYSQEIGTLMAAVQILLAVTSPGTLRAAAKNASHEYWR